MAQKCSQCDRDAMTPSENGEMAVCLMHSKDPKKSRIKFQAEIDRILSGSGPHCFKGFVFRGESYLDSCFVRTKFSGDADFTDATFGEHADFAGATFSGAVKFTGARFSMDADFPRAMFSGAADFHGATFSRFAHFDGAAFSEGVSFWAAGFWDHASFGWATVSGNASFYKAQFSGDAGFEGATFSGRAEFTDVRISGDANFFRVKVLGEADFRGAMLSGIAGFKRAAFSGDVHFAGMTVGAGASFDEAAFSGDADFDGTTFSRDASFDGATFERKVRFIGTRFEHETYFCGVRFASPQNVVFREVNSKSGPFRASFQDSDLEGVRFVGVHWYQDQWRLILLDEFRLRAGAGEGRASGHESVAGVYRQLVKSFEDARAYELAEKAEYGAMEMRRLNPDRFVLGCAPGAGWGRRALRCFQVQVGKRVSLTWVYLQVSRYGTSYLTAAGALLALWIYLGLLLALPEKAVLRPGPRVRTVLNFDECAWRGVLHVAQVATFQRVRTYDTTRDAAAAAKVGWVNTVAAVVLPAQAAMFLFALRRRFRR